MEYDCQCGKAQAEQALGNLGLAAAWIRYNPQSDGEKSIQAHTNTTLTTVELSGYTLLRVSVSTTGHYGVHALYGAQREGEYREYPTLKALVEGEMPRLASYLRMDS